MVARKMMVPIKKIASVIGTGTESERGIEMRRNRHQKLRTRIPETETLPGGSLIEVSATATETAMSEEAAVSVFESYSHVESYDSCKVQYYSTNTVP